MKLMLFYVLQQCAPGPMHNALGRSGRTRRVQNVERMVEFKLLKLDRIKTLRA